MAAIDPEALAARWLRSGLMFWAVAVLVTGVTALGTWRYWNNRFALDVTAGIVSIRASSAGSHPVEMTFPADSELQATGFVLLFPNKALDAAGAGAGGMRIKADTLVLRTVTLARGGGLSVTATPEGYLDLALWDGGTLDLMVGGSVRTIGRDGTWTRIAAFDPPVTLQLAPGGTAQPLRLVAVTPPPMPAFILDDQPVDEVRFSRFRPPGRDQRLPFQSEVIGGTLRLLDTGKDVTLRPRELVWLGETMTGHVARIAPARDKDRTGEAGFLVEATGTARSIGLGPPRPGEAVAERDLRPSVLDYILGQHDVTVIWTAVLAVLGVLWKARQWACKQAGPSGDS